MSTHLLNVGRVARAARRQGSLGALLVSAPSVKQKGLSRNSADRDKRLLGSLS